jgi:hypothetical protein
MIDRSGLYTDNLDQLFVITQGVTGATLVAGKQSLFRIYVDPDTVYLVDSVAIKVQGPLGPFQRTHRFFLPKDYLLFESNFPHGPSVGMILFGELFPQSGRYEISFWIHESGGNQFFFTLMPDETYFYPTKDLRLLVVFMDLSAANAANAPRPGWRYDILRAMDRLGSLFPVRDGVQSTLNGNRRSGIRYQIGTTCMGDANFQNCVYGQTRQINSSTGDHIDMTIEYRRGFYVPDFDPLVADPRPGGRADWPLDPRFSDLPRVNVVGGRWTRPDRYLDDFPEEVIESTGSLLAQEVGHHLGLEPRNSPHSDGGAHSKDLYVVDPLAFDFIRNRPYVTSASVKYPGDYMGYAWARGENAVLTNAFDWEYLRKELMNLDSTGTDIPDAPPQLHLEIWILTLLYLLAQKNIKRHLLKSIMITYGT